MDDLDASAPLGLARRERDWLRESAYNAGSGNVDEGGGAALEVDDIEFPETGAYVDEVLEKREQYRDSYADDLGL